MKTVLCLVLMLEAFAAAGASAKSIRLPGDNAMAGLKPGPGVEVVRANCVPCHSTDYIVRQPRSDAKHWEAEVKKMKTVFGAPISDADAKTIVEYLSATYGPAANSEPASGKRNAAKRK